MTSRASDRPLKVVVARSSHRLAATPPCRLGIGIAARQRLLSGLFFRSIVGESEFRPIVRSFAIEVQGTGEGASVSESASPCSPDRATAAAELSRTRFGAGLGSAESTGVSRIGACPGLAAAENCEASVGATSALSNLFSSSSGRTTDGASSGEWIRINSVTVANIPTSSRFADDENMLERRGPLRHARSTSFVRREFSEQTDWCDEFRIESSPNAQEPDASAKCHLNASGRSGTALEVG